MAQNVIINGVTYSDVPEVDIPKSGGGTAKFFDTTAADASAADVRSGKVIYGPNGQIIGSMTEIPDATTEISAVDQVVNIAEGYHLGGGKVKLSSGAAGNIVAGNIRAGVTILGVTGSNYVQNTQIASSAASAAQILSGYKAWVNGAQITGSMTAATVGQDSSTKILTIS